MDATTTRVKWGVAAGLVLGALYGAAWFATARVGVNEVTRVLAAERPGLCEIQAKSPCPFVVTASFGRDFRADGELIGKGSARYVWLPGLLWETTRDGPYIACGF